MYFTRLVVQYAFPHQSMIMTILKERLGHFDACINIYVNKMR